MYVEMMFGGSSCPRGPYLDCLTLDVSSPHRFAKDHPGCRYDVSTFHVSARRDHGIGKGAWRVREDFY